MFTTDPFSIRAERGMGEFDLPGTFRERGVEGEPVAAPPGAGEAATGEWPRSKFCERIASKEFRAPQQGRSE